MTIISKQLNICQSTADNNILLDRQTRLIKELIPAIIDMQVIPGIGIIGISRKILTSGEIIKRTR